MIACTEGNQRFRRIDALLARKVMCRHIEVCDQSLLQLPCKESPL